MAIIEKAKTAFITEWGTYCYRVMPFGLKNAGATYQRMATAMFHDMIHKEVEVYVDDMMVKSKTREEHPAALEKFLQRVEKYSLRLNPKKCVFGVTSGKMLGYTVSQKGIEVDPDKAKAIREMPIPKTEKEIRGFLGKLQFISRFIAKLTAVCEPIFKLLRKNQPIEWNEQCQIAFDKIKDYLTSPPILRPPEMGKPLILYLAIEGNAIGAMLAQEGEARVEHAVYYLSKKMLPYEEKYSQVEQICLAMVWAMKKLRHYFQSYKIQAVSKLDPMKYLFEAPSLIGKLAKWLVLLTEFDVEYLTKKTIKGRAVAEFLALNPTSDDEEIELEFPDDVTSAIEVQGWRMYFDGAVNQFGAGIGVILLTPENEVIPMAKKLTFRVTNNEAEYSACITGVEALIALGVTEVEILGDSMLVINQATDEWDLKEPHLKPYLEHLQELSQSFRKCRFIHLSRSHNQMADALASLASVWDGPTVMPVKPLILLKSSQPCYKSIRVKYMHWIASPSYSAWINTRLLYKQIT